MFDFCCSADWLTAPAILFAEDFHCCQGTNVIPLSPESSDYFIQICLLCFVTIIILVYQSYEGTPLPVLLCSRWICLEFVQALHAQSE